MKDINNLIKSWALPDRTQERAQLTVRIDYDLWAKLQALKEVYPKRSVNDMVADILRVGVDDIIEALPTHVRKMTFEEADEQAAYDGGLASDYVGREIHNGPSVVFSYAYSRILSEKTELESKTDEAS
jgi:hypothetical protein